MGALFLEPRTPSESWRRTPSAIYEANASPQGADTVFDIATAGRRSMGGSRAPLPVFGIFRNRGVHPTKTDVTHVICGDPAPGRRMPQDELTVEPGRICTESGPVLLTFRELEAAKKLQSEGVVL